MMLYLIAEKNSLSKVITSELSSDLQNTSIVNFEIAKISFVNDN